jgi:hypothetical protein
MREVLLKNEGIKIEKQILYIVVTTIAKIASIEFERFTEMTQNG